MPLLGVLSIRVTQEPRLTERWAADIDALQRELELRHIDLYHSIGRTKLTEQLEAIKRQLPNLTQPQIMIALMRSIQQVGDGHTQFSYWGAPHRRYPLRLQLFEDDLRVIGTDADHQDLLGMRLHGIGDTRLLTSLPADKAQQAITQTLEPELPEGFVFNRRSLDGLALYLDPARSVAYIRFDRYPTHRQMERFARGLKAEFAKHEIRRVIIDLRYNGGGDFFVGLTLA